MKIPPVKYMRDFYPDEMRLRGWLEDHWRRASLRAGFHEWDAPILEHLDLYRQKSGDEIVAQLFTLTTPGGSELAIRPEMTPSLARMVAQRQSALPKPIKWFCIARMCRYERGQRGRLREFFQWNADVLGVDDPVADAEVLSVALDALSEMGLAPNEIEARINSRELMAAALEAIGVPGGRQAAVYAVLDKRGKIPASELDRLYRQLEFPGDVLDRLIGLQQCESIDQVGTFLAFASDAAVRSALDRVHRFFDCLKAFQKDEYCRFDVGVVRGLAYYTGPVFEIFDRGSKLRALCGGGRYDNLMTMMGGQAMSACGFGMGDVVLAELLHDLGKTPALSSTLDFFVIPLEPERQTDALRVTQTLRSAGQRADFASKAGSLGKGMRRAADLGARNVVFVGGREWEAGMLRVRDMSQGTEREIPRHQLPL